MQGIRRGQAIRLGAKCQEERLVLLGDLRYGRPLAGRESADQEIHAFARHEFARYAHGFIGP